MSRRNNANRAIIDRSFEYARGSFKKVYQGEYIKGSRAGESCICKVFISGSVFEKSYFQHELEVVEKATEIVSAYNALKLINKNIIINQPEIWEFEDDKELNLVEPMIDNFEKFNSNTGWVEDVTSWGQVMQALTHFSYHHSSGQFTLCDLQGGVYSDGIVLTDPVVMSMNQRFGPTDLGRDGIENFFARHVCGSYCQSSWARPRRRPLLFQAKKGTTMIRVETRTGRSPLSKRYY
ncbi:hypothetical protein EMPS_09766 [Entomortierella parvispora]|uniref:Alpha-type protein kinase domain-containing protein n=1 Tax=Entomortierella parvispora TaxID=205924 RepID=A0A9P3M0P2_9FUNG|nr:hypothetical protein EMPS_09766 [Entomortierella parvispora]